jgi:GNAT superfamily N-acetyltransferase
MQLDPALRPADLAPGDRVEATRDWSELRVHRVLDATDSDFAIAYERLWSEFGARGEMERRRVIEERLAWDPARPVGDAALAYELLVLRRGAEVAALRDHTAVVRLDARGRPLAGPVVVHLSHAFVEPPQRGSGIAAWLRALPLETARRCVRAAAAAGAATDVVLVAEMEPPDPSEPRRMVRLRSYERAGFRKVDPAAAPYAQPDFRPAEPLGATREPIPLALVLRRVGREHEGRMPGAELAAVVAAIYAVYAVHVPAAALDPLRAAAAVWTAREPSFRLLPPTA